MKNNYDQNDPQYRLMATCPKGLESILAKELLALGGTSVQEHVAAVFFESDLPTLYFIMSWTRVANKIVLVLLRDRLDNGEEFDQRVSQIRWEQYFSIQQSIAVAFNGTNNAFRSPSYGAQRTKDSIQSRFNELASINRQNESLKILPRLTINLDAPEVRVHVRVFKTRYVVGIDLVGESLHKRGYRSVSGAAPLKENLAAAILLMAGWSQNQSEQDDADIELPAFVDPFCGSATLLIEACLIALNIAPSYLRAENDWLHKNLLFFSAGDWEAVRNPIEESAEDLHKIENKSVAAIDADSNQQQTVFCHGFDIDPRSLAAARSNISAALLAPFIAVKQCDIADLELPSILRSAAPEDGSSGAMLVSNPPYGSRLGDQEKLKPVYAALGDVLFEQCQGWEAAILNGNPELGWQTRLRSWRQHKVYNGNIECKLQRYTINPSARLKKLPQGDAARRGTERPSTASGLSQQAVSRDALSTDATMVFNRLSKNRKRLAKMLASIGVAPFRLYDRDLPEFAFMVDCYPLLEGRTSHDSRNRQYDPALAKNLVIHVQEYAAPATIDPGRAQQRADDFLRACSAFFERPISELSIKRRERQRGAKQYQKSGLPWAPTTREAAGHSGKSKSAEGQFEFYIDLERYLDTGIFIDSRGAREWIAREAKGKSFLNLFAYTATATLAAISGGAKSSFSLDMSATYLGWAKQNFELNGADLRRHQLHRADCLVWLAEPGAKFDLILLDPPSFSNSKKMQETLDIRRDHSKLIAMAMARLQPRGKLLFCTNKSGFKLCDSLHSQFKVESTTRVTLHEDCANSKHAHVSWVLEHKASV